MYNDVLAYPFWGPENSGPAENFAAPYNITGVQLVGFLSDSLRLKVPSETEYSQSQIPFFQQVPAFVPQPQGPKHVPDQFTQSRSLLDYANTTLATSQSAVP